MDQKLSQLDQRLHEIPIIRIDPKTEVQKANHSNAPPIDVLAEPHKSVELITLTEIPNKMPPPVDKKIQIPVAVKIPEDEKLDDDDKDIDKIKSEIMKALSKLEQVEVE